MKQILNKVQEMMFGKKNMSIFQAERSSLKKILMNKYKNFKI